MTDDTTQERMAWLQALMEKNGRQFGAYAATANAIEAIMQIGAEQERAKTVAWLRSDRIVVTMDGSAEGFIATAIEVGEHLKEYGK